MGVEAVLKDVGWGDRLAEGRDPLEVWSGVVWCGVHGVRGEELIDMKRSSERNRCKVSVDRVVGVITYALLRMFVVPPRARKIDWLDVGHCVLRLLMPRYNPSSHSAIHLHACAYIYLYFSDHGRVLMTRHGGEHPHWPCRWSYAALDGAFLSFLSNVWLLCALQPAGYKLAFAQERCVIFTSVLLYLFLHREMLKNRCWKTYDSTARESSRRSPPSTPPPRSPGRPSRRLAST